MTSRSLGQIMASVRCILLDFDGPVCSVFAGWPAPDVAVFIRARLVETGHPLSQVGLTSDDPLALLIDAARESPDGGRRAEELLQQAEVACVATANPAPGSEELLDVVGRPADPELMKPDPHGVLAALMIAGTAPDEAVLIGDSPTDAQAARDAGVAAVNYADKPHKIIWGAVDVITVTDLREITACLSG
jgi:HAD superfamily hydrolase (TIGR01509 family)